MKISIDIRSLMEPHLTGVGEYTLNLLEALFTLDQKNEYHLFANSFQRPSLPNWNFSNLKFYVYRWPNKLFNSSLYFLKFPKLDQLTDADIFFSPNIHFTTFSKKVKRIITFHDLSFECFKEFYSLKRRLWHKFINPQKLAQEADKIIVPSQSTKRDLAELYHLPQNKIQVIYSGVAESFFKPALNLTAVKQKYQLPDKFILYLGTLEPRKNIEGLIQAFEFVNQEIDLIIAGKRGWHYNNIYKSAQASPARKRLKFIDYVAAEDKPALYQLASLFIYPSFYEGFGFPPLEAMASGTPVIIGANSSLAEIAGSAAIMIDPHNIQEISRAIQEILTDQDLANRLSEKGKFRAREFSWQKTAQEIWQVFQQVVRHKLPVSSEDTYTL